MGGGVSKADLEKVKAEKAALDADKSALQADKQALQAEKSSLEQDKTLLLAEKSSLLADKEALLAQKGLLEKSLVESISASDAAANEERAKYLKLEVESSKVRREVEVKSSSLARLEAKTALMDQKLRKEKEKSVKRVMKVATNLLFPKGADDDDDNSVFSNATFETRDSVVDDTAEAIELLLTEVANSDPVYAKLQSKVDALDRKLEVEKETNSRLGEALFTTTMSNTIPMHTVNNAVPSSTADPTAEGVAQSSRGHNEEPGDSVIAEGGSPPRSDDREEAVVASPQMMMMRSAQMLEVSRPRDYSVLVDASASMRLVDRGAYGRSRWDLARDALESLVPRVVERDDDGITLYFFSSGYKKFESVNSVDAVRELFSKQSPKGGTMLSEALADAIVPDNLGRPETILVITDGAPENRKAVETQIVEASEGLNRSDDLRIVFVQVGDDPGATRWLASLKGESGGGGGGHGGTGGHKNVNNSHSNGNNHANSHSQSHSPSKPSTNLDCRFDVVETITFTELSRTGLPFAQWVARSVMPDVILGSSSSSNNNASATAAHHRHNHHAGSSGGRGNGGTGCGGGHDGGAIGGGGCGGLSASQPLSPSSTLPLSPSPEAHPVSTPVRSPTTTGPVSPLSVSSLPAFSPAAEGKRSKKKKDKKKKKKHSHSEKRRGHKSETEPAAAAPAPAAAAAAAAAASPVAVEASLVAVEASLVAVEASYVSAVAPVAAAPAAVEASSDPPAAAPTIAAEASPAPDVADPASANSSSSSPADVADPATAVAAASSVPTKFSGCSDTADDGDGDAVVETVSWTTPPPPRCLAR